LQRQQKSPKVDRKRDRRTHPGGARAGPVGSSVRRAKSRFLTTPRGGCRWPFSESHHHCLGASGRRWRDAAPRGRPIGHGLHLGAPPHTGAGGNVPRATKHVDGEAVQPTSGRQEGRARGPPRGARGPPPGGLPPPPKRQCVTNRCAAARARGPRAPTWGGQRSAGRPAHRWARSGSVRSSDGSAQRRFLTAPARGGPRWPFREATSPLSQRWCSTGEGTTPCWGAGRRARWAARGSPRGAAKQRTKSKKKTKGDSGGSESCKAGALARLVRVKGPFVGARWSAARVFTSDHGRGASPSTARPQGTSSIQRWSNRGRCRLGAHTWPAQHWGCWLCWASWDAIMNQWRGAL